jgi:hypothetical protein
LEPPVPRWSIRNTSRCLRTWRSAVSTMTATSLAAWPGPPARKNTGSGWLAPLLPDSSQAMRRPMRRPSGWARSSGTCRVAHCASTLALAPSVDSVQGWKSIVPKRRLGASLALPASAGGDWLHPASIRLASIPASARWCLCIVLVSPGGRSCRPRRAAAEDVTQLTRAARRRRWAMANPPPAARRPGGPALGLGPVQGGIGGGQQRRQIALPASIARPTLAVTTPAVGQQRRPLLQARADRRGPFHRFAARAPASTSTNSSPP